MFPPSILVSCEQKPAYKQNKERQTIPACRKDSVSVNYELLLS
jgi:hypothetical protein